MTQIRLDIPIQIIGVTRNNRIYTEDAIENVLKNLSKDFVFGQVGMPRGDVLELDKVSHKITDLRIETLENGFKYLVGTAVIMDTPEGKKLQDLENDLFTNVSYRLAGYGSIGDAGVVYDYKLGGIHAIPNEDME